MFITMAADDPVMQGARVSAAMVMTYIASNIAEVSNI